MGRIIINAEKILAVTIIVVMIISGLLAILLYEETVIEACPKQNPSFSVSQSTERYSRASGPANPFLTCDDDHNIYMAWEERGNSSDIVVLGKYDQSGSLLSDMILGMIEKNNPASSHPPEMVVDDNQVVHLFTKGMNGLNYFRYDPLDGSVLHKLINISSESRYYHHPEMILDENNNIHLLFTVSHEDVRGLLNDGLYYIMMDDEGRKIKSGTQIANGSVSPYTDPRIYIDRKGSLHVSWKSEGLLPGVEHISYSTLNNECSMISQPIVINNTSVNNDSLNIKNLGVFPDDKGQVCFVYFLSHHRTINGFKDTDVLKGRFILVKRDLLYGNATSKEILLNRTQDHYLECMDLVDNGHGRFDLAWSDNRSGNWDIYRQSFNSTSAPISPESKVSGTQGNSTGPAMTMLSNNMVAISFINDAGGKNNLIGPAIDATYLPTFLWDDDFSEIPIEPGEEKTLRPFISNQGSVSDTYHLELLDLPSEWTHEFLSNDFTLNPGKNRSFDLNVAAPSLVPEDMWVNVTIKCFSEGLQSVVEHMHINLFLNITLGCEITEYNVSDRVYPGLNYTVELRVENTGNIPETLHLGYSSPLELLEIEFDKNDILLLPGQRDMVKCTMLVKTTNPDDKFNITFNASVVGQAGYYNSVVLEFTVLDRSVVIASSSGEETIYPTPGAEYSHRLRIRNPASIGQNVNLNVSQYPINWTCRLENKSLFLEAGGEQEVVLLVNPDSDVRLNSVHTILISVVLREGEISLETYDITAVPKDYSLELGPDHFSGAVQSGQNYAVRLTIRNTGWNNNYSFSMSDLPLGWGAVGLDRPFSLIKGEGIQKDMILLLPEDAEPGDYNLSLLVECYPESMTVFIQLIVSDSKASDNTTEEKDSDGDGYNDTYELSEGSDPFNKASTPLDWDGDGVINEKDHYPRDPKRWAKEEDNRLLVVIVITIMLLVLLFAGAIAYSKLKNVMNHETRQSIYGYIEDHPGKHYRAMARDLDLPRGTLSHHLKVLVREDKVKWTKESGYKHYYPRDQTPRVTNKTILTPMQEQIFKIIKRKPARTYRDLARIVGCTPENTIYHVNNLRDKGLVYGEKEGREYHWYPQEERAVGKV